MRTVRVYSEQALRPQTATELGSDAAHHVSKVLRMRVGDTLQLFDESGRNFAATITEMGKRSVSVDIAAATDGLTESPLHTCLWLGVCRGGRMDYVIQKATELGVSRIRPVITERCVIKLNAERAASRQQHWQKIAVAAAEQSGRVRVPSVAQPAPLTTLLDEPLAEHTRYLILDPTADSALGELLEAQSGVIFLTGPEGGFTDAEVLAAIKVGFSGVRLGPRIMRSDTAPLAALTLAQHLAGDAG